MLGHARRSVLVVSYSIWLGSGPAADVIVQLAGLSSAGVDITFILDRRYQDGWNVTQLKSAWPSGHRRPSIWSWQHESDSMAKLHAKVIVVDRRDVLITSANLTSHGIDKNLELGLRVLGQPAEDAAYHFERLIQDGEFDKIEW
jgi:phosphatidylserine/phosphatidylglycerophosphate/cardiolipin synthase-like enzyme